MFRPNVGDKPGPLSDTEAQIFKVGPCLMSRKLKDLIMILDLLKLDIRREINVPVSYLIKLLTNCDIYTI